MKKINKYLVICLIISIAAFLLTLVYDKYKGNNDGLIGNIIFKKAFLRLLIVQSAFIVLTSLSQVKNKIVSTIATNFFSGMIIIIFFELLSLMYLSLSNKIDYLPSHILIFNNPKFQPPVDYINKQHYEDGNNNLGRWRKPNSELKINRCSDNEIIQYKANNIGARDKQRDFNGKNRVIVLGDSFIEGILINEEKRLSDILENKTKIEFLNFGIIGANPVQYYTIYKELVHSKIEHNKVIIGIFTGNDFDTDSNIAKYRQIEHPNYRPFWKKNGSKVELAYTLKHPSQSIEASNLTNKSHFYLNTRDSLYRQLSIRDKIQVEIETNSNFYSIIKMLIENKNKEKMQNIFNRTYEMPIEYSPTLDFNFSLEKLLSINKDLKILILLIPAKEQILNYKKTKVNKIEPYLRNHIVKGRAEIIDLMPLFSQQQNIERYFIDCDGHWSDEGNKFVSERLLNNPIFQNFLK